MQRVKSVQFKTERRLPTVNTKLVFFEKYPHGLMTPTHRPETGCRACRKGKFCMEHDYFVTRDMLFTMHDDLGQLMPVLEEFFRLLRMVPLPQSADYET